MQISQLWLLRLAGQRMMSAVLAGGSLAPGPVRLIR